MIHNNNVANMDTVDDPKEGELQDLENKIYAPHQKLVLAITILNQIRINSKDEESAIQAKRGLLALGVMTEENPD
tara:strand:+ start:354 stop:578 length:225 start_codon:yes stop_codon:yes gene_type:complete